MERNHSIDAFRLIGAFSIITLHAYGASQGYAIDLISLLTRWAIPFFFMISGYYFARNYSKIGDSACISTLKKIIGVLVISNVCYIPVAIGLKLLKGEPIPSGFNILYTGFSFHLWFLASLLVGYLAVWFFLSIKREPYLRIISVFLVAIALGTDSYDILFGMETSFVFPRFLLSIPFLYFGYTMAKWSFSNRRGLGLFLMAAGILFQFGEATFLRDVFNYPFSNHQFLVGTLLFSVGMFILALGFQIPENPISQWGKKYSLLIYIYHPIVLLFQTFVLSKAFPAFYPWLFWFNPIIALALTIIVFRFIETRTPIIYSVLVGNLQVKNSPGS